MITQIAQTEIGKIVELQQPSNSSAKSMNLRNLPSKAWLETQIRMIAQTETGKIVGL
jgi:hypothetical protein